MNKFLIISLFCLTAIKTWCSEYNYLDFEPSPTEFYNRDSLVTICDPKATDEQLYDALLHLGYVDEKYEKPEFWSKIANSNFFSDKQRALCIYQLFTRHIHAPIKLSKFAEILSKPTWIKPSDLKRIYIFSGYVPLHHLGTNHLYRLAILNNGFIFLAINSEIEEGKLFKLLTGQDNNFGSDPVVTEIGW